MKKLLYSILIMSWVSSAEDKHFVIDICSFNNAAWYKKNIDSVLCQDYPYYRIIYTDDASPDGTGDFVEKYIDEQGAHGRVLLIKNKTRQRALANHYRAIHLSHDNEIIITLDGDDWLAHEHVLSRLNDLYNSYDIWFAYTRFVNWPKKGNTSSGFQYSRPISHEVIERGSYRHALWVCGQLRTFYAWLAKGIKLEDLLLSAPLEFRQSDTGTNNYKEKLTRRQMQKALEVARIFQGTFLPSACDVALMIPMLEMADGRFMYIDEPWYIRNIATELNDHKVDPSLQNYCARYVRSLQKYSPLREPCRREHLITNQKATALVFGMSASPEQLSTHLRDVRKIIGIDRIYVIAQPVPHEEGTLFIDPKDFKAELSHRMTFHDSSYVFVTRVDEALHNAQDIAKCIQYIEQTYAHAVYFQKPSNGLITHPLRGTGMCFWQYCLQRPHASMALYRKEVLMAALAYENNTIEHLWYCLPEIVSTPGSIGLLRVDDEEENPSTHEN